MKKVIVLLVLVAILGGGALAGMAWTRLQTPYKGYEGAEQFVQIPPGAGASVIRERLIGAGLVQDALTLRLALRWTGASRGLQAGEYRFDRPMTAVEVVNKIARGDVYGQRITFPEGLTIREMAVLYESRGLGNAKDFIAAARNAALIQDLDPAAGAVVDDDLRLPVAVEVGHGQEVDPVAHLVDLGAEEAEARAERGVDRRGHGLGCGGQAERGQEKKWSRD